MDFYVFKFLTNEERWNTIDEYYCFLGEKRVESG